jgi:hypothetical protein
MFSDTLIYRMCDLRYHHTLLLVSKSKLLDFLQNYLIFDLSVSSLAHPNQLLNITAICEIFQYIVL